MDQRAKFAAGILAVAGAFSILIALADGGGAMTSKTRLLLSIVQPLVQSFGSGGAIGILMGLGIGISALALLWPPSAGSRRNEPVPARIPNKSDALAGQFEPTAGFGLRKRSVATLADREREAAVAVSQGDQLIREIATAAQAELDRLDGMRDERMSSGPPKPGIGEARDRPIVFAEHIRPRDGTWLSYYGGRPTVPPGFAWPVSANDTKRPIHFLMQWDCAQLAAEDATGLLPRDGVLYCFVDYVDGSPFDGRFLHIAGPTADWREQEPPASLGPVSGADQFSYCTWRSEVSKRHMPSLRPRWNFQPVAIDYPPLDPSADPEDAEAQGWFWNEHSGVAEELLKAQARTVGAVRKYEDRPGRALERPFPRFPHDWAAVRIVAAEALNGLARPSMRIKGVLPVADDDEDAKQRLIVGWKAQAEELFAFAVQHDLAAAVPQDVADDVWAWCETIKSAIDIGFEGTIKNAVNSSLGLRSAALDAIPAEWIDRIATVHALAVDYMRDEYPDPSLPDPYKALEEKRERGELKQVRQLHAPCPNRVFGPPSYVQGYVEEYILDHVLLLEMSSTHGIDFHLGDGVIQFMIKPDDLRERRFDKVMVVASAY